MDGTAVAAEALLRWRHPTAGPISPATVVGIAENTGIIGSLTFWVLNAVLRNAAHLAKEGITPRFSVNLSTRALVDEELPDIVEQALSTWSVPPERITLEITESSMIGDAERSMAMLTRLKGTGVQLSIDDFGTGYSSLAYLKRFPVDELKIDRLFVSGLLADRGDHQIVRSVIDLAHNFELRAVAEGVEEEAIREELRAHGLRPRAGLPHQPAGLGARLPGLVDGPGEGSVKRGFYTIMAAQFFSSLADNALLIASIALLLQLEGPAWLTPLLKFFFTVSYVVLAAFVGAFADSMPKGKVMFVTNTVKIVGLRPALLPRPGQHPEPRALLVRARRLRGGGAGRGRLFARQVRNPHRAPAAGAAGRRQRLDRGPHRRLHRAGHGAGRHPHRARGLREAAGVRPPLRRHRRRHARPRPPSW